MKTSRFQFNAKSKVTAATPTRAQMVRPVKIATEDQFANARQATKRILNPAIALVSILNFI